LAPSLIEPWLEALLRAVAMLAPTLANREARAEPNGRYVTGVVVFLFF